MKITKSRLQQIIREEMAKVMDNPAMEMNYPALASQALYAFKESYTDEPTSKFTEVEAEAIIKKLMPSQEVKQVIAQAENAEEAGEKFTLEDAKAALMVGGGTGIVGSIGSLLVSMSVVTPAEMNMLYELGYNSHNIHTGEIPLLHGGEFGTAMIVGLAVATIVGGLTAFAINALKPKAPEKY